MRTGRVTVEEYNPQWPVDFSRICEELQAALGKLAIRIEHVGSTSVPGMAAKPIIDLDVVIGQEVPLKAVISCLQAMGYCHEGDLGIPGRDAFGYEGKTHLRKHHLYVCREDSQELRRHVVFRDYLRTHPQAAQQYAAVKREGASCYPNSVDDYIAHKTPCIMMLYEQCGLLSDHSIL